MPQTEYGPERRRLIRKLESIADLTEEERQAVLGLPMAVRRHVAGQDIVRDGDRSDECCLVLEGFACSYKLLPDGRRQILFFHTPGDIPDLQSLHLGILDHAVGALTPTVVACIPHKSIRKVTQRHSGLLHAFWRSTMVDAAILRERVVSLGRRSAHERTAHLLCEMLLRFKAVGLAADGTYQLPVTQAELADALGLSPVHVNRVLHALRQEKLITWAGSTVTILKWQELQDRGSFDAAYLHQKDDEV
ncbi:Crp/Fnr family transcriptional regulator [Roseomonas chloroacetimidivorans]|uniref:Crp/Fnr family transcriptional regulator n=1 Tax=Roseomonas chloroacetimidivorans TaxID=1766656 RepID=UPI003C71C5DB